MRIRSLLMVLFSLIFAGSLSVQADNSPTDNATAESAAAEPAEAPAMESEPTPAPVVEEEAPKPATTKKVKRRVEKADAFIAPADWEFDGFVAGGQDQEVRSLYYLNDLVYLNVGTEQGFSTGDRVSIYKRGERIKDPQTGRFMGYEVRRAAASQVTDKVGGSNCSVRILQANEAVEVGDLVRRDQ